MAKYGFTDFRALDSSIDETFPGMKTDKARYFFAIDTDTVSRYGYGSPEDAVVPEQPDPGEGKDGQDGRDGSPTAAEEAVFLGKNAGRQVGGRQVPKGGCAAEADKEIRKGGVQGIDIVTTANERQDAYQRSLDDDRVKKVFGEWSACMKASGFGYRTPLEANNDRRWEGEGPASRSEITVARTDVACKQKTNTVGIWWAVLSAYEKRYIDEHAEHLTDVRTTTGAVMRNSARLVARGQ